MVAPRNPAGNAGANFDLMTAKCDGRRSHSHNNP
jgi:hypothetical protein